MTGSMGLCRSVGTSLVLGLVMASQAASKQAVQAQAIDDWVRPGLPVTQAHLTKAGSTQVSPVANRIADGHLVQSTVDTLTFSLQYPQDSQVTVGSGDDIEIVSETAGDPTIEIHTQARLLREDPADVVSQYIEQLLAEDALVLLYRTVAVDERSGFRLWLGEQPDPRTGELKNSLVTFVGYGSSQTAQIVSYYADDEAEAAAVSLHDSFTHLAPPDAEP